MRLGTGIKLRPLIASTVFLRVYIMRLRPGVERVVRQCVRVRVIIQKKEYNIHIIIIIILEFPFSGLGTGYGRRLPSDYNVAIVSPVWRRRPRRYRTPYKTVSKAHIIHVGRLLCYVLPSSFRCFSTRQTTPVRMFGVVLFYSLLLFKK